MFLNDWIDAARGWIADRLFPIWPALALLVVPDSRSVLIKDFDDFVRVFGGPEGRATTEQSLEGIERFLGRDSPTLIRVIGPEVYGGLQADLKDQHGRTVGTLHSGSAGYFPPATCRVTAASNGDPGCCDIIMEQGGLVLEHYKNKALDLNHPSVPQWERDAAEKERRENEDET